MKYLLPAWIGVGLLFAHCVHADQASVLNEVLFFHHGLIVQAHVIGTSVTPTDCHKANAKAIKKHQHEVPKDFEAFGLCIDTRPFAEQLRQAPKMRKKDGKETL